MAAVVETCASLSWHVVPLRIIHVAELAVAIVGSNSSPTFCPIPTNFLQVEEIGKRAPRKPRTNSEFSSISGSNDRKVEVSTRSSFSRPRVANPSSAQSPPGSFMSPFASSLAGKVQALENRMNRVSSDVKVLQKKTGGDPRRHQPDQTSSGRRILIFDVCYQRVERHAGKNDDSSQ